MVALWPIIAVVLASMAVGYTIGWHNRADHTLDDFYEWFYNPNS